MSEVIGIPETSFRLLWGKRGNKKNAGIILGRLVVSVLGVRTSF